MCYQWGLPLVLELSLGLVAGGVESQDVHEMERQIKVCEEFGIVSLEIHSAKVRKLKIQELLQQLQASVARQDLAALRIVLKDCKDCSLRQEYMEEALDLKARMEALLAQVNAAKDSKGFEPNSPDACCVRRMQGFPSVPCRCNAGASRARKLV